MAHGFRQDGKLVSLSNSSFETWQAAASMAFLDDFRSAEDADFARIVGSRGPVPDGESPFTGFLASVGRP